ncbi:MAG: hypothetical protein ACJ0S4_04860 [Candidatus Rariloculaceae bacterium]
MKRGSFKEVQMIPTFEETKLTKEQKSAMAESLEQVKAACCRDDVLGIVMFVGYRDGSYSEFFNGLVDPETTVTKLSKTAHRLLSESIVLEGEENV